MLAINPRNSFSVAASKRIFLPAGSVYSSSTLMEPAAKQHLGAWWAHPAATRALAALDAGLAGARAPAAGVVQDLLHFLDAHEVDAAVDARIVNGIRVGAKLRRRTAFVTGSGVAASDEWHELDTSQQPSALLLTHTFDDAPLPGSSLVLRTLFLGDTLYETTSAGMLRDVFQRATPVLAPASLEVMGTSRHYGPITDILINGVPLDAAALAVLPVAQRKAITAARRTQLLSVIRSCIALRWPGGFLAMRHFAEELLGLQARAWTEPLAAYLLLTRTGGVPTDDLISSHLLLADALAGAGKFAEAAAVRRTCLADDAAQEGGELLALPASVWYSLGILETKAGKYAAAFAAYRSGLAALDSGRPIHPMITDARVSRIQFELLSAIVCVSSKAGEAQDTALLKRMFSMHPPFLAELMHQDGELRFELRSFVGSDIVSVTVMPGGRRFAMTNEGGPWEEIREVLHGAPAPRIVDKDVSEVFDPSLDDRCIPAVVKGRCAACGAGNRKFKACGSCNSVLYCGALMRRAAGGCKLLKCGLTQCTGTGKECQVKHWPNHKAACKAARKQAS